MREAVTTLKLGTMQLYCVSHDFSTRATGEDFETSFASVHVLRKWPIQTFLVGLRREVLSH
jgi:hypothetical protein